MNERLKELVECIENWPKGVQAEAVAALETLAGYVELCEPPHNDC